MREKKAAAVAYTSGDYAPRVLARGRGRAADELCRIAARTGVPVVESSDLADSLTSLNPFESIPEEYWTSVAEILRFVYECRGEHELH